jgi:hypothetical protein
MILPFNAATHPTHCVVNGSGPQDRESSNLSVNLRDGAADFFYDGVNKL